MKDQHVDLVNTHNHEDLIDEAEKILKYGREKMLSLQEHIPESVQTSSKNAVDWVKSNPYKATSLGLLGVLSFKSKFARKIGSIILTTAATMYIKQKMEAQSRREREDVILFNVSDN